MFKQLKRKMLILNLSILTVLLLAVFTTLYLTSYHQIQNQIDLEIVRVLNNYREMTSGQEPRPPIGGEENFLPERSVSFVVTTDLEGEVVQSWFAFEADEETLIEAVQFASSTNGQFELHDSYWAYQRIEVNNQYVYAFLEISSEQAYLTQMIWTFVIVFFAAFIIVYVISNYFSNQSLSKVKESFQKQKDFIANASHELKTPLAIISTNADILIQEQKDNKWLNNIKYETERMSKLTKDLLYLTKMSDLSADERIIRDANLSEVAESTVLGFEALAYDKQIRLTYEIEKDVHALVDVNQLAQVFHILIDNAVKYANASGEVKVTLTTTHHQVVFSVWNTGEGISKKDIESVFDRFYMGDKSRSMNEKSYGLGLSIAKTIVDNHQGKLVCKSEVGKYTEFILKLKLSNTK